MNPKIALKIVVSISFGIYLAFKVDFKLLGTAIKDIDFYLYIASLLLVFANSLVVAVKFRMLAQGTGNQKTVADLFRINLLCRFYSTFLTTAIGQGILRWHFSSRDDDDRIVYVAIMVIERLSFLLSLLLTVAIAMQFISNTWIDANKDFLVGIPLVGCTILFAIFLLLSVSSLSEKIRQFIAGFRHPSLKFIVEPLSRLARGFSFFHGKPIQVWQSIGLSVIWQLLFILRVYLLGIAISLPFGLLDMAWMASLVLFIQILPVSFNGLGLRETVYAQLFEIQAVSPECGVALGLLMFSHVVIMAACGGVIQILDKSK